MVGVLYLPLNLIVSCLFLIITFHSEISFLLRYNLLEITQNSFEILSRFVVESRFFFVEKEILDGKKRHYFFRKQRVFYIELQIILLELLFQFSYQYLSYN